MKTVSLDARNWHPSTEQVLDQCRVEFGLYNAWRINGKDHRLPSTTWRGECPLLTNQELARGIFDYCRRRGVTISRILVAHEVGSTCIEDLDAA